VARRVTPPDAAAPPRLEVSGLTKTFGPVVACRDVSVAIARGTIHAVVGENGAGKTTLMRCVAGLTPPDAGTVLVDGVARTVDSVAAARALGIGMVHQEFSVVGELTLAENLVLGVEPTKRSILDRDAVGAAIASLEHASGWVLPWDQRAADVGVADLSRFELLRQLHRGSDILILDEPTAVLGPADTDQLLSTMVRLRDAGCTIAFITHKLAEVRRVSDRVTVLRAGAVAWSGPVADTDEATLARAMVGEDVRDVAPAARTALGPAVLETTGLSVVDEHRVRRLRNVDLHVCGGEIVGVYGVAGSGQRALVEALMGLVPSRGTVVIAGHDVTGRSPAERRHAGVAYISPDRRNEGLALDETLLSNVVAGVQRRTPFSRRGIVHMTAWRERYARVATRFDVRATGPGTAARTLSGGNQQRLVVGREIECAPRVLIASDPTRGVDVRGVVDIHRFLLDVRDGGGAVLLVSHDLDEVLAISDRVLVLLEGAIVGCVEREGADRGAIAELMTLGRAS
jgi:general nucleoside transport system ATP-binding protein